MLRFAFALLLCTTPALADVWTFETPSGNIHCTVGEGHTGSDLTCTIIERYGPPAAPRPSWCAADWGHMFSMTDYGLVRMHCEPLDASGGGFERAEYGVTGRFGGFTCQSERTGLTCRNLDGHGFFLSRRQQYVF